MKNAAFFLCCIPLLAQVAEPRVGLVAGRDGAAREVLGVAGAFLPGDIVLSDVIRGAAAGDFWVAKLPYSLRTSRGEEFDAPPGDALFGFSASRDVWIYLPPRGTDGRGRSLWRAFRSGGVDTAVCLPERSLLRGPIVALAGDLTLYVRRHDGLHALAIRPSDGAIESDTPLGFDARLVVAFPDGTLVAARDASVVVRDAAGSLQSLDLPDPPERLALMGDGWVHIRTASANFALRLRDGATTLQQLPEVAQ